MKKIAILGLMALLVGCSTVSGYKPVLNERADKSNTTKDQVDADFKYCQALAAETAGYATEGLEDALVAASGAAAIGAVSGAIITGAASAGVGAAAGGAIGGITGLWWGLYEADETYKRAYNSCVSQLGHPVLW
jgi:hypothetical protein